MKYKQAKRSRLFRLIVAATIPLLAVSAARADYPSTVQADGPKAYYRLNDDASRVSIYKNSGSLGAAGNSTNDLGTPHPIPGAIAGDSSKAAFFDFTSRTEIPWNAAINPPNTQPFTVEAWFYPASDQTATGQSPMNNRYAYSTSTPGRQGWVFFQRKPSSDYNGGEQVGWNFRMYRGAGSSTGLDITSLVPYQVGKWTHVVVVYDPVQVTNATVSMYIDGTLANTVAWTGGTDGATPGYAANTNDHTPAEAVAGPASLAIGNYNNTAGTSLNPYFGGVDEFAFYPAKLTAAQIKSHYQNATNASRTVSYEALIKSHNPVAYLRFDEVAPSPDIAINLGESRAAGIATHTADVRHPATSDGGTAYHNRNGNSSTTMPWSERNNPNAGVPFTFESWFRPLRDAQGGQCPVNNRNSVPSNRTGWVIFQRNPNLTYPAGEGHGWNFRMYSGAGGSGQDVLTHTDYKVGEWQHLVFTWEPQTQNGDVNGSGNDQWQGILTAYVNGVAVASNTAALYSANPQTPQDGGAPADLAVGSYNAKSGLGNNPYEGDVSDLAIYNNYVLRPEQILAHYQAGTNSNYGTNYETLVLTAPFTGPERQGPATYLPLSDPAYYPVANSGTLGAAAEGNLVRFTNSAAGPRSPKYPGFDAANSALTLDGVKQWASLNDPAGLEITGQITMEAWVLPAATQANTVARILSHGPPTPSNFLGLGYDNAITNIVETFLQIVDGKYAAGSTVAIDGADPVAYLASFTIPAADLTGNDWVHLAGVYDGANWKLFRNGVQVASVASAVGAVTAEPGDWAIGSIGNGWANNYTGLVDEVAIYSTALTPAKIAAHYAAATSAVVSGPLTIVPTSGGKVTITWPTGTTLQSSSTVNGSYTTVTGNPVSPLVITPGATTFYRWSK